ncbi:hypothetical protein Tco_1323495 [Tanacetum coccineum]
MERCLYTYNEKVGLVLHGFIYGPLLTNYSGLSKVFWADDITMSTYLVNRSPSPTIRFKTPIDVLGFFGTSLMQVLQGVEFEVEPHKDHTFEVEPHGNVDHVASSQEVQTQDLIYYHLAHDMDARSNVYVLSNSCKKCSDDSDGYYWEYTPGDCDVEKNGKWSCIYAVGSQEYQMVCTRLHMASAYVGILDKFDRGLQIDVYVFVDFDYAIGRSITVMGRSITRYGLMIQGCAGSLEATMLHMMALLPTEAGYMTLTEAAKEAIRLKGLAIESGFELKIVAGITTGSLSKAIPGPRF